MIMTHHITRNIAALLLVLTLANLAASFMALRAVRAERAVTPHLERVDAALERLTAITTTLCQQHGAACDAQAVSEKR
jgi:hypothetical protein